jgi:hypothetical protein
MANAVYPLFKQTILSTGLNLTSATIKVILLSSGYTYSASHQFISDLGANIIARTAALSSKTVTNGVFNAASPATASAVASGTVSKLAIANDTGTDSASPLIMFIDTVSSGLPVTANGGDINVNLDTGANKIFAL